MQLLVVEDDDIVRMLMVEVLDELGYKDVLEADSGEQALVALEDSTLHLDLLMTDVGLPDMNGNELAAKARALRPTLPVLFASGYAESMAVPEGMHMIGKPFSMEALGDKIRSILGELP